MGDVEFMILEFEEVTFESGQWAKIDGAVNSIVPIGIADYLIARIGADFEREDMRALKFTFPYYPSYGGMIVEGERGIMITATRIKADGREFCVKGTHEEIVARVNKSLQSHPKFE